VHSDSELRRHNHNKKFYPLQAEGLSLARYPILAKTNSCSTHLLAAYGELHKGQTLERA
jgi:hypothetical protein